MMDFDYLPEKYHKWHYLLRSGSTIYRERYLDDTIGKNEYQNNESREDFVQSLFQSLSLNIYEKKLVFENYKDFTLEQFIGLDKVFKEEKEKFLELKSEHPEDVYKLSLIALVEWVFIIDNTENPEIVLLDIIELIDLVDDHSVNLSIVDLCLERLYDEKSSKSHIYFFEIVKDKYKIDNENWNRYLNSLANNHEYEKLKDLIFVGLDDPMLISAYRTYHIMRKFYFSYLKNENIKDILNFKRKYKSIRFDYELSLYYFKKENDFNKFFVRQCDIFSRGSISDIKSLYSLSKHFSYSTIPMFYLGGFIVNDVCKYIYNSLVLHIENSLKDIQRSKIEQYFIKNKTYIEKSLFPLVMFKEGMPYFFRFVNKYSRRINIDNNLFLIQNIISLDDNLNDLSKSSINEILKSNYLSGKGIMDLCLSLHENKKYKLYYHLLNEYYTSEDDENLRNVIEMIINGQKELSIHLGIKQQRYILDNLQKYSSIDFELGD